MSRIDLKSIACALATFQSLETCYSLYMCNSYTVATLIQPLMLPLASFGTELPHEPSPPKGQWDNLSQHDNLQYKHCLGGRPYHMWYISAG